MSVSLRDAVKFKKGYDQVMARLEAELDDITGGLQCSEHGGYGVIIRNTFLKSYGLLSDEWPIHEFTTTCIRCHAIKCCPGCRWAYIFCRDFLGKPYGFK